MRRPGLYQEGHGCCVFALVLLDEKQDLALGDSRMFLNKYVCRAVRFSKAISWQAARNEYLSAFDTFYDSRETY